MFHIFNLNHQKNTILGEVEEHICPNCDNTEYWILNEVTFQFRLFQIPLFVRHRTNWFCCPICINGITLDEYDFKDYKLIAEINKAYVLNSITENERFKQLTDIYVEVDRRRDLQRADYPKESPHFIEKAKLKSDSQLLEIVRNRFSQSPALVVAAEKEIERRSIVN